MDETFRVVPIGWVESSLVDPGAAPKQGSEGAPEAWLVFRPELEPGLSNIGVGTEILVMTWLHLADRDTLVVHPRDDPTNPLTGVFSTRSADRPNPIGIHRVPVLEVAGPRIRVAEMEAVDRTPIIDVKPVL